MRADRLLSILLLLQVHRRVTARDFAKRLEVSERTILRDMEALSMAGVPVVAERGAGGGWSLLDGYQTTLTGLSAAEIQALFLARPARLMADLGLKQESEAALIKLQASLPAASRDHADFARQRILVDTRGWRDPAESIACLPMLLDALWKERQVRFVYSRVLGEAGERTVDPLGLVAKGSAWYLIANVEGEPRTYRVSRMREASILDQPCNRPAGFDLAAYWERSAAEFREKLPRYYATFTASREVMRWVRYRGWRLEEESAEGDFVRVRMRFDSEEEALQFALSFGGEVGVIEPSDLRAKVLAGAEATAARYAEIMPQTPANEPETPDTSHSLDMVTLFSSSAVDAEMEAMSINSILQSNGIPSVTVGASTIPVFSFEVQVPREDLETAKQILAEAQAGGPAAADEAELASE